MEVGVSIERAIEIASLYPLNYSIENISIKEAHNRILSVPLESNIEDPLFDNSAMDGWAVIESDCIETPVNLKIIGTSQAGFNPEFVVTKGHASRIMTGAPIPQGADSIVMIEDSETIGDEVIIKGPARPNYIRKKGENIQKNERCLNSGILLKPPQLAIASMMGFSQIPVIIPPQIAIIGTGDELVEPGNKLKPGQIYESNTKALIGLINEMGCKAKLYSFVSDDLDKLRETFNLASRECDAIITSGGVSMGEWDLVRKLMENEGDTKFWKIQIKPGGPPLFGLWNDIPLFGLPGNPVSSQVVFMTIVSQWISNSCNYDDIDGPKLFEKIRVKLLSKAKGSFNKVTCRRINILFKENTLVANVLNNQGSGNLRSMVDSNGLTLLPIGVDGEKGDFIDALWIR
tara:strand:- start:8010 stop:9218 length:1209 start_codon:yes stop_codon:yes gene_type:complete